MYWVWLSLGVALFSGLAVIAQKKVLIVERTIQSTFMLVVFLALITSPLFFFIDYASINLLMILSTFVVSLIGSLAFLFLTKGIRHSEVSSSSPLIVLEPGVIALFAYFALGEVLSLVQIAGIVLLVLGGYLLSVNGRGHNSYLFYVFVSLILYGFNGLLDRTILSRFAMEPVAFIAFVHVFTLVHLSWMFLLFGEPNFKPMKMIKKNGWWLLLIAALTLGYRYMEAEAVKVTYVGLVSAIKRSSILLVVLLGGGLFHEDRILYKVGSCIIMVAGVVLIVI